MKNFALLLTLLLVFGNSFGQKICGFDEYQEHLFAIDPHYGDRESALNTLVKEKVLEYQNQGLRGGGEILVIPVVVHIIHQNGDENISDETVLTGIEHLNLAFSNSGIFFDLNNTNTNIQFCLAKSDPDGNLTSGINRVVSPLTDVLVPSEEMELKDLIRWDPEQYLNLWIVKAITREEGNEGVLGFSSFPTDHGLDNDGVVCEAEFFGATPDGSGVHIHEIGHYLGLYHTFHNGCDNADCLSDGDLVCDTPPDSHVFNSFCFDGTNSCSTDEDDESENNPFRSIDLGGLGDQVDLQDNFLDYSSLLCFSAFTNGQADRMFATIVEARASLLEGNRCLAPCDDLIEVDIVAENTEVEFGEELNFINNSDNYTLVEWFVDGTLISSEDDFSYTFENPGVSFVEVTLSNDTDGCQQSLSFEITVVCPVSAEFFVDGTNFSEGEEILFENLSEGANTYGWYVDGVLVSNGLDLSYTFESPGGSSVYLVASNGDCEVQSDILFVNAGTCASGREHNIWNFFNPIGNFYGFNFNLTGNFIDFNVNNLDEQGHCKTTLCDHNGNLMFISTGDRILNKNYEVMPNGSDLMGNVSSHFGTMIMEVPGSDELFYLFTTDSQEQAYANGLRYSIVDKTLDGGLGDVTDEKNILLEFIGAESISTIRHCNLTDFWLVFYDIPEQAYKSYLVTSDGISVEPVVYDSPQSASILFRTDLRVAPAGNQIIHYNHLLNFDQATGEFEQVVDFDFEAVVSHEFSPNGKMLYMETGLLDVVIRQFDLTLPLEDMLDQQYIMDIDDLSDVGTDMKLAPDGKIYKEEIVTGNISVIDFPNLPGELMGYDDNAWDVGAIINTFGNFHHGYISGQYIFIEGVDTVCRNDLAQFEILQYDCLLNGVDWEVENASFTVEDDGSIAANFNNAGLVTIRATVETDCGIVETEKLIVVKPLPEPDLGPDMAICLDVPLTLFAPEGYQSYLWSNDEISSSIEVSLPGNYTVTVEEDGCSGSDEISIGPAISPSINLGQDTELCDSEILLLEISPLWVDPIWQDGFEGSSYTIYEGGTYSVSVTMPCPVTDEIFIDDCGGSITGIEEIGFQSESLLFPNPSQGQFTVQAGNGIVKSVVIYDSLGKEVYSWQKNPKKNGSTFLDLDLTHVGSGHYSVMIVTDIATVHERLIIVN